MASGLRHVRRYMAHLSAVEEDREEVEAPLSGALARLGLEPSRRTITQLPLLLRQQLMLAKHAEQCNVEDDNQVSIRNKCGTAISEDCTNDGSSSMHL